MPSGGRRPPEWTLFQGTVSRFRQKGDISKILKFRKTSLGVQRNPRNGAPGPYENKAEFASAEILGMPPFCGQRETVTRNNVHSGGPAAPRWQLTPTSHLGGGQPPQPGQPGSDPRARLRPRLRCRISAQTSDLGSDLGSRLRSQISAQIRGLRSEPIGSGMGPRMAPKWTPFWPLFGPILGSVSGSFLGPFWCHFWTHFGSISGLLRELA